VGMIPEGLPSTYELKLDKRSSHSQRSTPLSSRVFILHSFQQPQARRPFEGVAFWLVSSLWVHIAHSAKSTSLRDPIS
jgi:hypothetical protein